MYLKVFKNDDNHHGFQYKDGLNVDTNDFRERGSCVPGGLYFTTIEHIAEFLNYGDYIRVVEVPEGASMVEDPEGNKWRASSLFLHPKKSLNDIDTWKWLINEGIDVSTSFALTAHFCNSELIELLIKHGAIVGFLNNYALRSAAVCGDASIVKLLIKHGADCTADNNGAIRLAIKHGNLEVVKVLVKHGADCTVRNNIAIRYASENGHLEIIELLLKHGADCTVMNNIAIRMASRNGYLEIVALLEKHGAVLKDWDI